MAMTRTNSPARLTQAETDMLVRILRAEAVNQMIEGNVPAARMADNLADAITEGVPIQTIAPPWMDAR